MHLPMDRFGEAVEAAKGALFRECNPCHSTVRYTHPGERVAVSVPTRSDCTVCWPTGRSLRVKRSVRRRKGDSGNPSSIHVGEEVCVRVSTFNGHGKCSG